MDRLQLKIHLNQFKYGYVFMVVLDMIHQFNIFNLPKNESYSLPYIELCESFFEILIKEVTYHNYIIILKRDNYLSLITNCLDKAIYLRDKCSYVIDNSNQLTLCTRMEDPISVYLNGLSNQIKIHIGTYPLATSQQNSSKVSVITCSDLEKLAYSTEYDTVDLKVAPTMPSVKMQPIYPRVPLIGKDGGVIYQKNFLDI